MNLHPPPLDRTAFSVTTLDGQGDDRAYWLARTPEQRWAATEALRRLNYGYDAASAGLRRVLEVARHP